MSKFADEKVLDLQPGQVFIPGEETVVEINYGDEDVRSHNVGSSDYAKHKIQPWDIWLEYKLNPWDADIIKRTLREKGDDPRRLDYEKIIHICQERIRQIDSDEKSCDEKIVKDFEVGDCCEEDRF